MAMCGAELMDLRVKKIAVAGAGYVGLAMATLLARHHEVMIVDVIPEKAELLGQLSLCRCGTQFSKINTSAGM